MPAPVSRSSTSSPGAPASALRPSSVYPSSKPSSSGSAKPPVTQVDVQLRAPAFEPWSASRADARDARESLTFVHDVVLSVPAAPETTDVDLSDGEKREVLARLTGADRVLARLVLESDLSGLRTGEAFQAAVRDASGCAMRTEPLTDDAPGELSLHLRHVRELYEHERAYGEACVPVPSRVEALFPEAAESWEWQFVFPAARRRKDGRTGRSVRVSTDPSRVMATIAAVQTAETRISRLR